MSVRSITGFRKSSSPFLAQQKRLKFTRAETPCFLLKDSELGKKGDIITAPGTPFLISLETIKNFSKILHISQIGSKCFDSSADCLLCPKKAWQALAAQRLGPRRQD